MIGGLRGGYCAIDHLVSGLGTFGRDLIPMPKPQRAPSIVFTTEDLHFIPLVFLGVRRDLAQLQQ